MCDGYFDFTFGYWLKRKLALCEAQNWRCCYCKFRVELIPGETDLQNAATFEHLNPTIDGGSDDDENLVIACQLCNKARNRGNYYRFERIILQLLQNPLIHAAWHKFDDRLLILLKREIMYARMHEKVADGKPSSVRHAARLNAQHRTLIVLVEKNVI